MTPIDKQTYPRQRWHQEWHAVRAYQSTDGHTGYLARLCFVLRRRDSNSLLGRASESVRNCESAASIWLQS